VQALLAKFLYLLHKLLTNSHEFDLLVVNLVKLLVLDKQVRESSKHRTVATNHSIADLLYLHIDIEVYHGHIDIFLSIVYESYDQS